jgi:cyclic pyranopterin monophosphate synthase
VKKLSHVNERGEASMVDVSSKPLQQRKAVARGQIILQAETVRLIESNAIAKGNVLAAARLAGILAAKKTGDLIPLCHPLPISHCEVEFEIPESRDCVLITASAKITAQTGVEMEALTAVSVAALTIYDMCKAVDKRMRITEIELVSKTKKPHGAGA